MGCGSSKKEVAANAKASSSSATEIFLINGFYMAMREKFTAEGASIYYLLVEWDSTQLSWADFRGKVLGATDPSKSVAGSLRATIFSDWKALGLADEPNTGNNGVHGSASPMEGLFERMNWTSTKASEDEYGKALLEAGISEDIIQKWSKDPKVELEGKEVGVFDAVEDTNADECLAKAQKIAAATMEAPKVTKNQAFVFIKPHAVKDKVKELVKKVLGDNKIQVVGEGTLEGKVIDENKLIDNHYYAIANKACLRSPKDLQVPDDKKEEFQKKWGVSWEKVLEEKRVFNAKELCDQYGINGQECEELFRKDPPLKFGGGFYCAKIKAPAKK